MNRIITIILLMLIIAGASCKEAGQTPPSVSSSRPKKNSFENMNLINVLTPEELHGEKDSVIQVGESLASIINGQEDKGDSTSYTFNDHHQLVLEEVYNKQGKLVEATTSKYDTAGNLISLISKSGNGGEPFSVQFFYNTEGQVYRTKNMFSTSIENKTYQYDQLNYLTQRRDLIGEDSVWRTTHYSYDDKGNLVLVLVKSAKGDTVTKDQYSYNNLNQRIRSEHSGAPINCTGRNEWQYSYNTTGDIVEEKTGGLTVRYKYEYDDRQNWTKKYGFYNKDTEPVFLVRRLLKYKGHK